jgi:hypothetical protein
MRRRRTNQSNFQERRRKHVVDKAWSSVKSEALPHTSHRPHLKTGADAIISFRFRSTTKYPLCGPVLQDGTRTGACDLLFIICTAPLRGWRLSSTRQNGRGVSDLPCDGVLHIVAAGPK